MFIKYNVPRSAFLLLLNEVRVVSAFFSDRSSTIITDEHVIDFPYEVVYPLKVMNAPGSLMRVFENEIDYKNTGYMVTSLMTGSDGSDGATIYINQIKFRGDQTYRGGETVDVTARSFPSSDYHAIRVDAAQYMYILNYIGQKGINIFSTFLSEEDAYIVVSKVDETIKDLALETFKVHDIIFTSFSDVASKLFSLAIDLNFIRFMSVSETHDGIQRLFVG